MEYTDSSLSITEKILQQMKDLMITQTTILKEQTDMSKKRLKEEEDELEEDLRELFEMEHIIEAKPAMDESIVFKKVI